jgi:hypothetical protein
MKSTLSSLKSQLLCAGLLLGAAASSAFAGSLGVTYPSTVGNSNIGSTSNYALTGANTATSASLTGVATSSVTLLGTSAPLETFAFTSKVTSGVPSNNASLVIGSYIVFSQTTTDTVTWNKSTTQTFVTSNTTVSVPTPSGAIPVTVTGTLSGSGEIDMTSTLTKSTDGVNLTGNVGTDVGGTASATVAAKYKDTATVSSDLTIGHATLNANTDSDTSKTMSGTFTLSLDASSLSLLVELHAITSTAASTAILGSTNLGSFVIPARVYTLLSL